MRIGSIVKSNVDYQIGIVTDSREVMRSGWIVRRFCVLFPDKQSMWLSRNVLDLICE